MVPYGALSATYSEKVGVNTFFTSPGEEVLHGGRSESHVWLTADLICDLDKLYKRIVSACSSVK